MALPLGGSREIFEREYFEHNPVRKKGRGKDGERIKEGNLNDPSLAESEDQIPYRYLPVPGWFPFFLTYLSTDL